MSPSPFDSPDSLDIELWQSPPRRVKMRPWGAFDLLYNTVLFSVLLLVGVSGLAATVFARPFSWSLAAIGLLPALFFVLPSLLGLASHAHNVSRCRALVRSGKVRRARVESITLTTDKYPEHTYVLVWLDEANALGQTQARRETVKWRGFLALLPARQAAFEVGQLVSILENPDDTRQFLVYQFSLYQADA